MNKFGPCYSAVLGAWNARVALEQCMWNVIKWSSPSSASVGAMNQTGAGGAEEIMRNTLAHTKPLQGLPYGKPDAEQIIPGRKR